MSEITFIIPTIDRPTIKYSLESLQAQTVGDWRAIVAGDGLIPSFASEDERITVVGVHQQFSAGRVRNLIVNNIVYSDWVGFLDDDDELYPEYVENFLDIKSMQNPDIIIFKMNNYGSIVPTGSGDGWMESSEIRYGNIGMSFCLRRSCFKHHQFDDEKVNGSGEDFRFIKSLYSSQYKIWLSSYLGYHVRKTSIV